MDQIKIGAFIAQLRLERGWTQEELGERLGVTNKTISRWENGNYMPGVEMLTLLGKEFSVTLNELLEGRRLDEADFRAAADEKLAAAMLSPGERVRKWLTKYGTFAAVVAVLCMFLGMSIYVGWQYRQGHPEDVSVLHSSFMYRQGFPNDPADTSEILYLSFHNGKYYIFTPGGEYLEWGNFTQDGDAVLLDDGETARWIIIKGRQIRDVDPRDGTLIAYENLFDDHAFFIGNPNDIP